MLSSVERKILEILNKNLIMRREELRKALSKEGLNDGAESVNRLRTMGYINVVDAVGSTCLVLTRDGSRALRNMASSASGK